jgi:hypothetical protein
VADTSVLEQVGRALDTVQTQSISGNDKSGAVIATSDLISANDATRFANDLCAAMHTVVLAVPSVGSMSVTNQAWGNRASPQIYCVNGLPGSGDSVVFGANTGGAGILVVRDAELVLAGDFRWEGWVIVSGSDVGFRVTDTSNKEILGALLIHESGNATGSGPPMLDIQGSVSVGFSRQALSLVAPLVPAATLSASYLALPFFLTQDHWRSITP